jgi:hypothetical protein
MIMEFLYILIQKGLVNSALKKKKGPMLMRSGSGALKIRRKGVEEFKTTPFLFIV